MKKEGLVKEIWRDIPGYEGIYIINDRGVIRTLFREFKDVWNRNYIVEEKILKPSTDTNGYKQVVLSKNGKRKSFKVHRLVAQTFIPNPNNYPQINHKDENKLNNNVDNLEWCTQLYNCQYGTRSIRCTKHRKHKVKQIKENNVIATYNSMQEAEKETGVKYQNIYLSIKKNQKAGGYRWEYV